MEPSSGGGEPGDDKSWDWTMEDAELPMPRLPFSSSSSSARPKEEGPGSPSVSTDVGDELRIPAQAMADANCFKIET